MSRYAIDPPDEDRYDAKPVEDIDVPDFDQPDPPVDPAEHAAHELIDALTDLEKAIATATTLERAHQLKAMLKRAYTQVNAVDLKASAKIDQLVEQRR